MDTGSFFAFGLLFGFLIATAIFGLGVPLVVKHYQAIKENRLNLRDAAEKYRGVTNAMLAILVMGGLMLLKGVAHAQETPVPLDIPINDIMTSTNSWLVTFAPIAAIGIGISIALAVLGYLGKMIRSAFA